MDSTQEQHDVYRQQTNDAKFALEFERIVSGEDEPRPGDKHFFHAGVTKGSEHFEVFCNGERLPLCTKAHAAQGWATVFATNEEGTIAHDGLGRIIEIVCKGTIKLIPCNHPQWNELVRENI